MDLSAKEITKAMVKKIKNKEEILSYRQKICNLVIEIKYLEEMIKKHKENPIDDFLGGEIERLQKEKKALIKYGEGN